MRALTRSLALAIGFSLAFWPFLQMLDASEMGWCANLDSFHRTESHMAPGGHSGPSHEGHRHLCCHQSALRVPTLAANGTPLGRLEVVFLTAPPAPAEAPPSPFQDQEVPPG